MEQLCFPKEYIQQLKKEMLFYHYKGGMHMSLLMYKNFMFHSSYGTFGDLGVFYSVHTLDLSRIAERVGTAAGDYFLSPVADITLTASSTVALTNLGSDALSICLSQCLSQVDCQSFVLTTANDSCLLYAVARTNENTAISSGTQYYEKNNDLVT